MSYAVIPPFSLFSVAFQRRRGMMGGAHAEDMALQANSVLATGLSLAAGSKLLQGASGGSQALALAGQMGQGLAVIGLGIETVRFSRAVVDQDAGAAVSTGAGVVGGVWGLWNPYVAVAIAAGNVGKVGIQSYYKHKSVRLLQKSRKEACWKWKLLFVRKKIKCRRYREKADDVTEKLLTQNCEE